MIDNSGLKIKNNKKTKKIEWKDDYIEVWYRDNEDEADSKISWKRVPLVKVCL